MKHLQVKSSVGELRGPGRARSMARAAALKGIHERLCAYRSEFVEDVGQPVQTCTQAGRGSSRSLYQLVKVPKASPWPDKLRPNSWHAAPTDGPY